MNTFAKLVGLFILGVGLLSITACSTVGTSIPDDQYGAELQESFQTLQEGVAALVDDTGSPYCSGVFVAPHKVLTAAHCVEGVSVVHISSIYYFDGRSFWKSLEFGVADLDEQTDAAYLMAMSPTLPPATPLPLAEEVFVGERIYPMGHPVGMGFWFSEGRVVALERILAEANDQPYTLTNARVIPGMSGGPVVNTRGQVMGLNSFYWADPSITGLVTLKSLRTILGD